MIAGSSQTPVDGASIFLVTDGKENRSPYIRDVLPTIKGTGIKVNTLAYGSAADPGLESLAFATQGESYFYTGKENSTGLSDAFKNVLISVEEPFTQVPFSFLLDYLCNC